MYRYTELRNDVKINTKVHYNYSRNILLKYPDFSNRKINSIKLTDAKAFLIQLSKDGKSRNTVRNVRGVLRPAFEMAVRNDLIIKNPL